MSNRIFIVTSVELGWDCIVGVFDPDKVTLEELQERFRQDDSYVIFDKAVKTNLEDY